VRPAGRTPRVTPALLLGALLSSIVPSPAADRRIDLARATWTRNGVAPAEALAPASPAAIDGAPDRALIALPCDARGVRWATSFETERGCMARLTLDWNGGPDGLLFEVVIDGQRLMPARDAWRPSPRELASDLGPFWLGPGGHLFEIVAREKPAAPSAVRLAALEVEWLRS
jgi:hypothetical protein